MMKGKTIAKLIMPLCIGIMLFAGASGTAFAVSYDREISPNGTVSDTMSGIGSDESKTYKVVLPQSGRLTIDIDSKSSDMNLKVRDEAEKLLELELVKEGGTRLSYDLIAGTYYLEFENNFGTVSYNCSLSFKSAGKTFDGTDNTSIEKVRKGNAIAPGTKVNGFIAINKEEDIYKVVLPQSGRLSLNMHSDVGRFGYSLYDDADERIDGMDIYEGDSSMYHDLAAGTYYLKFSYAYEGRGMFSFLPSFKPAKETYNFKNNTINLVRAKNAVPLGKTVKGQIAINDDTDVYKYKIPKKGKYALRITSKVGRVYVKLYDSHDNNVTSFDHDLGAKTYTLELKKGTYYLSCSNAYSYSSPSTGTYTFRLRPASVSIKRLTPAKKSFKARWKKGTGNGYELQYSTSKSFKKNVKTVKIRRASTTSKKIKKLKKGKRYYVRIRTFVKSDGKICRSAWSKTKSVKVK